MAVRDTNALSALNAEWRQLGSDPYATRLVLGWLAEAGVFFDGEVTLAVALRQLARRDRQQGREHTDVWLGALLRRAVGEGEQAQLAARVVVQAMLPHATRTVQSLLHPEGPDWAEVAQVVVACLYQTVRCYPLGRRPRRIAANVTMDTRKAAVGELRREWRVVVGCEGGDLLVRDGFRQPIEPEPYERAYLAVLAETAGQVGLQASDRPVDELAGARGEVVSLLLWALEESVLSPRDARVINDHFQDEPVPDSQAAEDAGVLPATVRQWRSRAVRRLQAAAPGWLAEAA